MHRSTREVFEAHLAHADNGNVDEDIRENFDENCILLTTYGRFEGHAGVRKAADLLARQLPDARFQYLQKSVAGEIAFLEWTGRGRASAVHDGADSFLVRNGKIHVMTIHYTLQPE